MVGYGRCYNSVRTDTQHCDTVGHVRVYMNMYIYMKMSHFRPFRKFVCIGAIVVFYGLSCAALQSTELYIHIVIN